MWFLNDHLSPENLFEKTGKFKRVWHNHENCEDVINGMWSSVTGKNRAIMIDNAIDFTGDHILYGHFMLRVVNEWPIACEHNLTSTVNRKAWVGHAACCMALGIPEDITRSAWKVLSDKKRRDANKQAAFAITEWERGYAKNLHREKCFGCSKRTHIGNIRPVQQSLFELFRGEGQHSHASPCNG